MAAAFTACGSDDDGSGSGTGLPPSKGTDVFANKTLTKGGDTYNFSGSKTFTYKASSDETYTYDYTYAEDTAAAGTLSAKLRPEPLQDPDDWDREQAQLEASRILTLGVSISGSTVTLAPKFTGNMNTTNCQFTCKSPSLKIADGYDLQVTNSGTPSFLIRWGGNGTFTANYYPTGENKTGEASGTYTIDGNKVTVTFTSPADNPSSLITTGTPYTFDADLRTTGVSYPEYGLGDFIMQ